MPNSGDKRWEEKDDGISTLLRQQNEELIKKYEHQCQISKDLAKENETLFNNLEQNSQITTFQAVVRGCVKATLAVSTF